MRRQTKRTIAMVGLLVLAIFAVTELTGNSLFPSTSEFDEEADDFPFKDQVLVGEHHERRLDSNLKPSDNKNDAKNAEVDRRDVESRVAADFDQELTHEELVARARSNVFPGVDSQHMHGKVGYKADGTPAWTPLPPMTSETAEEKREHHKGNCFNLRRSDSLPLDRFVGDVRHPKCKTKNYPSDLPVASVVFVFYNEPPSPLYRSIHSVLNRTPPHLLHEIVLVDDCSDAPALKEPLEEYIKLLPKVRLVRLPKRSGLMTARTAGARAATGEALVFLDSHIECSPHWLEPMLARIKEDRKHVVMPIIDSIDADNFDYHQGGIDTLGFSWSLGQKFFPGRPTPEADPLPSVIMAGGLFALDRKLFKEIGEYDPEMQLYGGEEVEISLRIWQCGMTLECIPCSRVGHIFRTSQYWQGQVYKVPGEVIIRNKLRAAEVWMDEYKQIAFDLMAPKQGMDLGPLEYMYDVRKRLNCKPFKWLLDNVYPELFVPDDRDVEAKGEFKNPATGACLDTLGSNHIGSKMGVYPCHGQKGTQYFVLSRKHQIRVAQMDFDSCLDRSGNNQVSIWSCQDNSANQKWYWDQSTGRLSDEASTTCLEATRDVNNKSPFTLVTRPCDINKPEQVWNINSV